MKIPHVVPYQGSKRKIAEQILRFVNFEVEGNFYEPFAGSAAITLSAAVNGIGKRYIIGDKYKPLIDLWEKIILETESLTDEYQYIWEKQLDNPKEYYLKIRDEFNYDKNPVKFLYLVARCVKNAIRFNSNGNFNQSADNRRLGMKPSKLKIEAFHAAELLKGKVDFRTGDFIEILEDATENDLVYMDPPWQGTSNNKDPRYAYILDIKRLIQGLSILNEKKVPFMLSFDGSCGDKKYGDDLPSFLKLKKVDINAGRSSQATLLGRNHETIESLYLSPAFLEKMHSGTRLSSQSAFSY